MSEDLFRAGQRDFEDRLRRNRVQLPSPQLRDRIVRSVEIELAVAPQWDGWKWLSVAAAAVLLLNVSMISASRTEFNAGPAADGNQLSVELHAVQVIQAQDDGNFQ